MIVFSVLYQLLPLGGIFHHLVRLSENHYTIKEQSSTNGLDNNDSSLIIIHFSYSYFDFTISLYLEGYWNQNVIKANNHKMI